MVLLLLILANTTFANPNGRDLDKAFAIRSTIRESFLIKLQSPQKQNFLKNCSLGNFLIKDPLQKFVPPTRTMKLAIANDHETRAFTQNIPSSEYIKWLKKKITFTFKGKFSSPFIYFNVGLGKKGQKLELGLIINSLGEIIFVEKRYPINLRGPESTLIRDRQKFILKMSNKNIELKVPKGYWPSHDYAINKKENTITIIENYIKHYRLPPWSLSYLWEELSPVAFLDIFLGPALPIRLNAISTYRLTDGKRLKTWSIEKFQNPASHHSLGIKRAFFNPDGYRKYPKSGIDFFHINSIAESEDGYWVSSRDKNLIFKIDKGLNKIVDLIEGEEVNFFGQHHLSIAKNGDLLIFDNHFFNKLGSYEGKKGPSRILRLIKRDNKWQTHTEYGPDILSPYQGSAYEIGDQHFLVHFPNINREPVDLIQEIRNGSVQAQLKLQIQDDFYKDSIYRAIPLNEVTNLKYIGPVKDRTICE